MLRTLAAAGRPDGNGRTGRIVSVLYLVKEALLEVKHRVRSGFKFYSQDLINHLFAQPYTRVAHLIEELGVSRVTATRYLDDLAKAEVLKKVRVGRNNYYVNTRLVAILAASP